MRSAIRQPGLRSRDVGKENAGPQKTRGKPYSKPLSGRNTNAPLLPESPPNSSSLKRSLASSWNMIRRQMADEYEKDNSERFVWGDTEFDRAVTPVKSSTAKVRQLVSSPAAPQGKQHDTVAVHRYLNERLQRMRHSEREMRSEVQGSMKELMLKMEQLGGKEDEYLDGLHELGGS